MAVSANRLELLQIADAVLAELSGRERNLAWQIEPRP